MPGLLDFWGGDAPASTTSTITSTGTQQPAWMQDYTRGLMGASVNAASQDFQPYGGARLAGQSPLSQQASSMTQSNIGAWQPGINFASQTAPSQVQAYMNPYQNQVVDRISQLGQRNLQENLLPQVNSTFTGEGQFGSSRNQEFTNRALRDTNEATLAAQGQLLNQGYNQATTAFQNDANRIGNAAVQRAALGLSDASAIDILGNTNQALDQRNLDMNYQNFEQQRVLPQQNLSWLNEIVRGLPSQTVPNYQNQVSLPPYQQQSSPLLQAANSFSGIRSLLSPTQRNAQ